MIDAVSGGSFKASSVDSLVFGLHMRGRTVNEVMLDGLGYRHRMLVCGYRLCSTFHVDTRTSLDFIYLEVFFCFTFPRHGIQEVM